MLLHYIETKLMIVWFTRKAPCHVWCELSEQQSGLSSDNGARMPSPVSTPRMKPANDLTGLRSIHFRVQLLTSGDNEWYLADPHFHI